MRAAKHLKIIGESVFSELKHLAVVKFNEGLDTIKTDAFWGDTLLSSITFPSSLKAIEATAFGLNESLKHIVIKRSEMPLTIAEERAFESSSSPTPIADPTVTSGTSITYPSGTSYKTEDGWKELVERKSIWLERSNRVNYYLIKKYRHKIIAYTFFNKIK